MPNANNRMATHPIWTLVPIGLIVLIAGTADIGRAGLLTQAELRIRLQDYSSATPSPVYGATFDGENAEGFSIDADFASLMPGNAFAGSQPLVIGATGTVNLTIGSNALGEFSGPPLAGPSTFEAALCLPTPGFPGVCFITIPFAFGGTPVSTMRTGFVATAGTPVPVSVLQAPFTTGIVFAGGTFTTPIIATGSNQLTPNGAGQTTLVTPINFAPSPGVFPQGAYFVGIAELELHYAPEPGLAVLLMWGAAWLCWQGTQRRRS